MFYDEELKLINLDERFTEYFGYDSIEKITKEAESYNCDVVIAKSNELQFDIDVPIDGYSERVGSFFKLIKRLETTYGKENVHGQTWSSKSGNTHGVLTVDNCNFLVEEAIALQAIGGSDPDREFAALQCTKLGSPHPRLLFRPKNAVVESW